MKQLVNRSACVQGRLGCRSPSGKEGTRGTSGLSQPRLAGPGRRTAGLMVQTAGALWRHLPEPQCPHLQQGMVGERPPHGTLFRESAVSESLAFRPRGQVPRRPPPEGLRGDGSTDAGGKRGEGGLCVAGLSPVWEGARLLQGQRGGGLRGSALTSLSCAQTAVRRVRFRLSSLGAIPGPGAARYSPLCVKRRGSDAWGAAGAAQAFCERCKGPGSVVGQPPPGMARTRALQAVTGC